MFKIICGDNLEVLKDKPDNYYDSVVTDPPYGLGKEPDANLVLHDWLKYGYHKITGKGFLGNEWDSFVPQPNFWKEIYRVLKPGGHILSFAGTRTYDWMVMSMRLAGFEVRDMITWNYGSGMPKSLNISKAIYKKNGIMGETVKIEHIKRKPYSKEAKDWNGYGTGIKPTIEPIVLARKPISEKSIVDNVLKWETGALNIDGCRIKTSDDISGISSETSIWSSDKTAKQVLSDGNKLGGRFPANSIFDDNMCEKLDNQSGHLKTGSMNSICNNTIMADKITGQKIHLTSPASEGGASRFFFHANFQDDELEDLINFYYCAKPSQSERNAGCENIKPKERIRQGLAGENNNTFSNNFHPTVKPIQLMRYLCKLITPKGGLILEPFAGSGTTGIGAIQEGFKIELIEREKKYISIIEKRINYWKDVIILDKKIIQKTNEDINDLFE